MRNATTDFLIDTYSVNFSGNLKVDGAPVSTGSPFLYPFGNTTGPGGGPVEASFFFDTTGQTVNVTSSYTGEKVQIVATGGAGTAPPSSDPAYLSRVNNLSSTINSIAINLETEKPLSVDQARDLLAGAPGIKLEDDPKKAVYPMPVEASGRYEVLVGRIRKDPSVENGLALWCAGDNIWKGAAQNAIQIAEKLIEKR